MRTVTFSLVGELARYQLAASEYDFEEYASDWLDAQLLYYLADPLIHFRDLRYSEDPPSDQGKLSIEPDSEF